MDLIPDGNTETPQFCGKTACALQLVQRACYGARVPARESVCHSARACVTQ